MSIGAGVAYTSDEDCVGKVREAVLKAEVATHPEAKRAWQQIANRWARLAEQRKRALIQADAASLR
jgi:hypothetical protein